MNSRLSVLIINDEKDKPIYEILGNDYNIITANGETDALDIMRGENRPDVLVLSNPSDDFLNEISEDKDLRLIPAVIVLPDNKVRYSANLETVEYAPNGNITAICQSVKNVLRLSEFCKLKQENERLKSELASKQAVFADKCPEGVAIIRTDGVSADCDYFNEKISQIFHITPDEFLMRFVMPKRPEWLDTIIEKSRVLDKFSFDFTCEDEEQLRWVKASVSCTGNIDGKKELYCVFVDISNEKNREISAEESDKELRESRKRLETVVNNAPGGISFSEYGNDGKFHTLYINQGLVDLLGYSSYDECLAAVTENCVTGVSDSDAETIKNKISQLPEKGGTFKYVFTYQTNGGKIWISMRCQIMRGEDGKVKLYAFVSDITKEKRFEDELRTAAFFDPLTGLFNRHAFMRNARRLLDENPLTEYAIMRLNIRSFKVVNDLFGRDVGDKVLLTIADAFREVFNGKGVFARFFADNFAVITPYSERGVHPRTLLNTVQKAVLSSGLLPHEIQYYIGVYRITDRGMSVESMADRSAIACRSINGSFQEHIAYYDEKMRLNMIEEQEICDDSRRALENGEFCVYYQPVYGIKAKRFVSAEALVRWDHPIKGMISPGKFVPVFEKNGFIAELDLYVLEQVCKYMKRRREAGLPKFPISVNISRMSLYDANLFDTINDITNKYGIETKYFRIEITESAYNDNPEQLLETVGKLRASGFPVLMDDFGSGYSSLNTLKDIPIDILKLDMKFMEGFEKNGKVGTIVTSVARMAKWLNVPLLAEGVESKEQFDFLESIGCAYIQGFYFSRPISENEFTEIIKLENIDERIALSENSRNTTTAVSDKQGEEDGIIENYALNDEVNELLGSNALVSKLISGAFGGFGIYEMFDDKLEVIRVNEGYERIIGYTPDEISEKPINVWEMMPPEDAEISRRACIEALYTDKAVHAVVHRYDADGKLITLDSVHRKLGGAKDNPIICIAFNDITEQLASERRADLSRTEIDEILNATDAIVTDMDFESGNVYYAGDLSDYNIDIGRVKEYIEIGTALEKAVHPDDLVKVRRLHSERTDRKRTEEFRLYNRKDQKYYWWKFTEVCSFDENGKMTRLIGIANNIDSEKRAKLELEEERSHADAVMSRLSAGILMVEVSDNHQAHIIYSNKSFWDTIGQKEVTDADFFNKIYFGFSEKDKQEINDKLGKGETVNARYQITRQNGENAVLDYTIGLSRVDMGHRIYMILVSDVTEQYNNRVHLEAIVRNYHDGLALVNKTENGIEITYANDKFYSVFDTESNNSARIKSLLETVLSSGIKTSDIRIKHGNSQRIVRVNIDQMEKQGVNSLCYIVAVSDVTIARSESKNRIAERMAYAQAGMYDEVIEINYRNRTIKLTSSRREPKRAENAKAHSFESIIDFWGRKYVSPDDYHTFRNIILAPAENPDFTDTYCEVKVLDTNGEYSKLGLILVRSHGDVCMLFVRDKARFDNSLTSAQVAETYRLYNLVAEQTETTVIEIDHVEKKISYSPSLKKYWSSKLSDKEIADYEYAKQGLTVYPEDKKRFDDYLKVLFASDNPQTVTLRLKMSDGSYKWCRISVSLTRGKDNRVLTSLCTINLVHDEVIAGMKARETDEFLRRTVAHIPVGVGVYRLDGGELVAMFVSDNMHKIIRQKSADYYSDIENYIKENNIGTNDKKEHSKMTCLKSTDDSEIWIKTIFRVLDENGEQIVYMANSDVTESVESKHREEARDQMYRVLLDESGMIVFAYDTKTDAFSYLIYSGDNNIVTLENITADHDNLTQIHPNDREKFTNMLKNMSSHIGFDETLIRIIKDDSPRRYGFSFKSVADKDGNVFKVVGKIEDVEKEVSRIEQIEEKAMYDSLCVDLFNKSTTEELVRTELERNPSGAVMMLDVDDFKSINDSLGHIFGDEFLKEFASIVKGVFRESDIVGRYGGDEFFVFMPHATVQLAEKKASQILEGVSKLSVPLDGGIKCSIGISGATPDNNKYTDLLNQADCALYQAKNRGKNCAVVFDESMGDGSFRVKEPVGKDRIKAAANVENTPNIMGRAFDLLYSSENVTDGINDILAFVGKTFNVSRAYIFENTDNGECCRNTFEWCSEGISHEINLSQTFSYKDDFGGNYFQNADDGVFYCHDINELNEKCRKICERRKTKSMLECAVTNNGKFKGFVGIEECENNRFWTKSQIDVLKFVAKLFSITFMK